MAEARFDPNWEDLKRIFTDAATSNPKNIDIGTGVNRSPFAEMGDQSQLLNYIRQQLPEKVGNTNWYNDLKSQLPNADLDSKAGFQRRVANALGDIPLGGFSNETKRRIEDIRATNERVRQNTVEAGKYRTKAGPEATTDSFRAKAAQTAGVASADAMGDGLRNIWWFLNAPQAVANIAGLQAVHSAAQPYVKGLENPTLIRNRQLRMAATAPAVVAMSTAIGNIGRPAGYKAVLPSDADPRRTDEPVAEAVSRYFLGRTGKLLPYAEFAKERPDVSQGEYNRYKAYLFNKQTDLNPLDGDLNVLGALRATTDGIHGPEVNFMGKSIPVMTGILPTAAAVAGIRRGIRTAGRRLQESGDLQRAEELRKRGDRYQRDLENISKEAEPDRFKKTEDKNKQVEIDLKDLETSNQGKALGQSLLYGSLYGGGAGLVGQALELGRRGMSQEDV